MENQSTKLDKAIKICSIVGIVIIVPAVVYFTFYLPYAKQRELKKCLEISENNFSASEDGFSKALEKNGASTYIFEFLDKAKKEKKDEDDRCYMRHK